MATGLPALDAVIEGFPRGAISEIVGPETSGKTTLLHSLLAVATSNSEICAYVDTNMSFDPVSAARTGVSLPRLIWIRCQNNLIHALKSVDYLLHAGGFGIVVLDLGDVTPRECRRVLEMSYWYRFRRAIERSPTLLVLIERESMAKSCASLRLEMKRRKVIWSGEPETHGILLKGVHLEVASQRPWRPTTVQIDSQA